MYCLEALDRGGNTGVQAVIQIDSCGSGGLSETLPLLVSIDITPLTALDPRLGSDAIREQTSAPALI